MESAGVRIALVPARSTTDGYELAQTVQELDESRGNHAFYMSVPPK